MLSGSYRPVVRKTCHISCNIRDPENLSTAFLIRDNLIKLISDQRLSVELALLDGLYILLELYKNQPITKAHIQEYFSDQTLNELNTAMEDIHIPDEDTFIECNELLQDLSVNYRKEGLYTAFLQPVLTEACKYSNIYSQSDNNSISRTLQTSQKQFGSMLTDYDIVFRNYLANELFTEHGFEWGGDWTHSKDYQHFEK